MEKVKTYTILLFLLTVLVVVFGCSILGYIPEVSSDEFKDALHEVYGIEYDEISEGAIRSCHVISNDIWAKPVEWSFVRWDVESPCECGEYCENCHLNSDEFENEYNRLEEIENDYDIEEIRRSSRDNSGYIILSTSDEDLITELSTYQELPDSVDSLFYAYYYTGSTSIFIQCLYDNNDTNGTLEKALEFIEYLELPQI